MMSQSRQPTPFFLPESLRFPGVLRDAVFLCAIIPRY
jgi:hypothetical protein